MACECDGCTTEFESVRRGSIPWRATFTNTNYSTNGAVTLTGKAARFKTGRLRVRTPLALLEERQDEMNTKQTGNFKARKPESAYTLQLANGKTKSFESAEALAKWMSHQRGLVYRGSTRRSSNGRPSRASRRNASRNNSARSVGSAPLARYANRNSNEA